MQDVTGTINLSMGMYRKVQQMERKFDVKGEWDPHEKEASLGKKMEIHLMALRAQVKELETKTDQRRS